MHPLRDGSKRLFGVESWLAKRATRRPSAWYRYKYLPAPIAQVGRSPIDFRRKFEQAAKLTCTDVRIELFGHRRTIVPISKTVIRGKNMVTLIMPEEQYYQVRNRTRGSIEYAEASE